MRRASLYSSSNRSRATARTGSSPGAPVPPDPAAAASSGGAPASARPGRMARIRGFLERRERLLMLAAGSLIALAIVYGNNALHPSPRELSQEDIDGAVMHTLETKMLPSQAARAYEAIRGSVVRVRE